MICTSGTVLEVRSVFSESSFFFFEAGFFFLLAAIAFNGAVSNVSSEAGRDDAALRVNAKQRRP